MVVYTRIHLVIVSIHTPTQGVTTSIMYPAQASQFQSTHPRRVWPFCTFAMCSEYVSIHTPTQGVTMEYFLQYARYRFQSTHPRRVWHLWPCPLGYRRRFQSTHPRRVWPWCRRIVFFQEQFQSTHPRRVWHQPPAHGNPLQCFNPHTHAGCDSISNNIL